MLTAALLLMGMALLTASCSTVGKRQLLEVYNVHGSEATARLTVNGNVLFTTSVFIGKNGIGKTGEGPKNYTGGCIAFDEERMVDILRNCNRSLVITIRQ